MPNLYTVMITFESEGDAEAFMVGENIFSLAAPAYDHLMHGFYVVQGDRADDDVQDNSDLLEICAGDKGAEWQRAQRFIED